MKLSIVIPHGGYIEPLALEHLLNAQTPPNTEFKLLYGYSIDRTRNLAIEWAQQNSSTHLLQIDSDIAISRTSILEILELAKPFATGAYLRKDRSCYELFQGGVALTELELTPFEVEEAGAGFYCIELAHLERIPRPYYLDTHTDRTQRNTSEDRYFCKQLQAHGYTTWVDPRIQLQHIAHTLVGPAVN